MNYALMISTKVEEKLAEVFRNEDWSQEDETVEYNRCLNNVLAKLNPKPLVSGEIRIGDYILLGLSKLFIESYYHANSHLVDSDTRIPDDCLLDAVSEMQQSPEVAILQYTAGILHVSDDFFERGIS